ncbi:hypothetical protein D9M71_580390 [compost metagenome]
MQVVHHHGIRGWHDRHIVADIGLEELTRAGLRLAFDKGADERRGIGIAEVVLAFFGAPLGGRLERAGDDDPGVAEVQFLRIRIVLVGAVEAAVLGVGMGEDGLARGQALLRVEAAVFAELLPEGLAGGGAVFAGHDGLRGNVRAVSFRVVWRWSNTVSRLSSL